METVIGVAVFAGLGLWLIMWGMPKYGVYSSRLSGVASLAEAQAAAEVRVREARAERDAATLEAEAEVERAKGCVQGNRDYRESSARERRVSSLPMDRATEQSGRQDHLCAD